MLRLARVAGARGLCAAGLPAAHGQRRCRDAALSTIRSPLIEQQPTRNFGNTTACANTCRGPASQTEPQKRCFDHVDKAAGGAPSATARLQHYVKYAGWLMAKSRWRQAVRRAIPGPCREPSTGPGAAAARKVRCCRAGARRRPRAGAAASLAGRQPRRRRYSSSPAGVAAPRAHFS